MSCGKSVFMRYLFDDLGLCPSVHDDLDISLDGHDGLF